MRKFNQEEHDRIKSFLNKKMTISQSESFEEDMKSDKDLANEVHAQEFERVFEYLTLKAELKETFNKLKQEEQGKVPWVIFINQPIVRAVAASLLIAIIGTGLWFGTNQYKAYQARLEREKLHKDSLEKAPPILPPNIQDLISSSIADSKQPIEDIPKELNDLVIQYERADKIEDYKKVARRLAPKKATSSPADYDPDEYGGVSTGTTEPTLVEEDPKTAAYRAYYHGLTLLALEKYDAALRRFDAVQTNELTDRVQWYKALTYLKKGDKVKSEEALKNIAQGGSEYKAQAQKLIDSMK